MLTGIESYIELCFSKTFPVLVPFLHLHRKWSSYYFSLVHFLSKKNVAPYCISTPLYLPSILQLDSCWSTLKGFTGNAHHFITCDQLKSCNSRMVLGRLVTRIHLWPLLFTSSPRRNSELHLTPGVTLALFSLSNWWFNFQYCLLTLSSWLNLEEELTSSMLRSPECKTGDTHDNLDLTWHYNWLWWREFFHLQSWAKVPDEKSKNNLMTKSSTTNVDLNRLSLPMVIAHDEQNNIVNANPSQLTDNLDALGNIDTVQVLRSLWEHTWTFSVLA